MPSLFSRARTTSTKGTKDKDKTAAADGARTPTKNAHNVASPKLGFDEFGRVVSRDGGGRATPSKSMRDLRLKTSTKDLARPDSALGDPFLSALPDGSFLPLQLDPPRYDDPADPSADAADAAHHPPRASQHRPDYGFLSYQRHVVLPPEHVSALAELLCAELAARGLTTPFLFSSSALDVSASGVRRLVGAFLEWCRTPTAERDAAWREEARFAGPHELAMALRWGLARVVRVSGGQEIRGLLDYKDYVDWRDAEAASNYPAAHFAALLPGLHPLVRSTLLTTLALLARLTAHAARSGHTPPTLSPLFGPLLFGLGPASLPFRHAYVHYLRAARAAEHVLLAFVRWQDLPAGDAHAPEKRGWGAAMGVPPRLKDWIRGYPATLPGFGEKGWEGEVGGGAGAKGEEERPRARKGARTVRVVAVRRNVRMYSPDLVRSAAGWAQRAGGGGAAAGGAGANGLAGSKEWERVAPSTLKLPPRYSDGYRKRMDMPPGVHPDTAAPAGLSSAPSAASSLSASTTSTLFDEKDYFGVGGGGGGGGAGKEGEFKSLTDLKWGEFETVGFGGLADNRKLQFDLTEGARAARQAKRQTMSWDDFSSSGFTRSDAPLSATLQFSTPLATTISSWPSQRDEIHRKLKKVQKGLPSFGWDTEPVMGPEEWIEEAFLDVFCDLIYGGGWMDSERDREESERECNWALVEFKSLPVSRTTVSGTGDPRTSTSLFLFEEFVPAEYRAQLASFSSPKRRRLPSLFTITKSSSGASRQWKPATTLNGRPYAPGSGQVPQSPSLREVEFEGLLRGKNASVTKVVTLEQGGGVRTVARGQVVVPPVRTSSANATSPATPEKDSKTTTPARDKTARFGIVAPQSMRSRRESRVPPADSQSIDFETRLASMSDDDGSPPGSGTPRRDKRRSKDDAWVDILVATAGRRMAGQDADPAMLAVRRGLKGGRSDPELASQEVAAALAAVQGQVFSDDEDGEVEPAHKGEVERGRKGEPAHRHEMEAAEDEDGDELSPGDVEPAPPARDSMLSSEFDATPRTSEADESEESGSPAAAALAELRKRAGMGYFAAHPDRLARGAAPRPASNFEDPRARLARDEESDEEEAEAQSPYGGLEDHPHGPPSRPVRPLPVPQATTPPAPASITPLKLEVPLSTPPRDTPSPAKDAAGPISPGAVAGARAIGGKTSALIEMYRQKEKGGAAPSDQPFPTQPSRLPVRLLPTPGKPASPEAPAIVPSRSPSRSPNGSPANALPGKTPEQLGVAPKKVSPNPSPPLPDAVPVRVEPVREASVPRYVHGAPLHNLVEEEEEE
ncbi:hypothetical protein PUNSTDRAFT_138889 [Punctularia strigosozonata HHB-11173 SS5]|uniref:Meiotically up-regulated protein Msb1/Mug8 domain-containing protein n=1 Tax=Punctularia strigosozonata (strain HHB-11173) TaxID=741275 RepID=R7S2U1_PUNST|nr:uncharacterized protein PUNSTDRAFT_138889 [Punctularia strigosozonata HHB-11173 SS5]EIN04164.1 hypothetical protein PUNSTDRAFT_138889 [Punctularia strigosozonata HHB-11173 SS5]